MSRFSVRSGVVAHPDLQIGSMDARLRNTIWNFVHRIVEPGGRHGRMPTHYRDLHETFFARPNHEYQIDGVSAGDLRAWYATAEWYEVYDLLEHVVNRYCSHPPEEQIDQILRDENAGYRWFDGRIVPVFEDREIAAVREVDHWPPAFAGARSHIREAVAFLSARRNPDYRHAACEAIHGVESAARVVSGENGILSRTIRVIGDRHRMHPAFVEAIIRLYGWAGDEPGVRHALRDETSVVDEADARFMIVTCSAFIGLLVRRHSIPGREPPASSASDDSDL